MKLNYSKTFKGAVCCMGLLLSTVVIAEPRTNPTTIANIRTLSAGFTLVTVASRSLSNPGAGNNNVQECTNSSFRISDGPAANTLVATALTAAASGSEVIVEISSDAATCGFATEINSIFLVSE